MSPARAIPPANRYRPILHFPSSTLLRTLRRGRLRLRQWGRRRRNRSHLDRRDRRNRVFENQLFLVVGFQNDRILIEPLDLTDQFYTAYKEDGDGDLFFAHGVEVDVLNVLGRCFVFHGNSLKFEKRLNKLTDLVLNFFIVSRSIEPSNIRLIPKPGYLTFRVTSRVTLNYTNGFFHVDTGIEIRKHVAISNGFERLGAAWNAICYELPYFVDQPERKHVSDAIVDPAIEL